MNKEFSYLLAWTLFDIDTQEIVATCTVTMPSQSFCTFHRGNYYFIITNNLTGLYISDNKVSGTVCILFTEEC